MPRQKSPRASLAFVHAPDLAPVESEALAFLCDLSSDYPQIKRWFCQKVVPGLHDGRRFLFRVRRNGQLVGLGIGKREPDERKICTVRVAPSHAGLGIGVRIFDALLRWLDVDRPTLTVSESKLHAFERIFDHFGFEMTSKTRDLYVRGSTEIGYNEFPSLVRLPSLIVSTDNLHRGTISERDGNRLLVGEPSSGHRLRVRRSERYSWRESDIMCE